MAHQAGRALAERDSLAGKESVAVGPLALAKAAGEGEGL